VGKEWVTVPWGGETADALAAYRDAAINDPTQTALAPLADDPSAPFEVTVTWQEINDKPTPVAVELRSRSGQPVTGDVWRSVRVAHCVKWSRHYLGWVAKLAAKSLRDQGRDAARVEQVGKAFRRPPGKAGRPPSFGPEHFAEVARVYQAAVASGSRRPVRDVAVHMERNHPGDSRYKRITGSGNTAAKGWVARARALGLIPGEED
jgi:hypothetical protein